MKNNSGSTLHGSLALMGTLLLSACAAQQTVGSASSTSGTQVAVNTCGPGSMAAVMSAKLPPNARPGNPEIYKDCR